jgi:RNA methyltransferase, TrmH family
MSGVISSQQNPIYKKVLSLTKSKGVKEHGLALVCGPKITHEISSLAQWPQFWIYSEEMSPPHPSSFHKDVCLSRELFSKLDVCGTHSPILCVEPPPISTMDQLDSSKATLYLGLSDPNNLGALVRTCAAFEWPQIVLLKEAAHPFLPKTIRASSGTSLAARFFNGPSIHDLRDEQIMALDGHGTIFSHKDLKTNMKLLIGEEGLGVPPHFAGKRLKIPISNKVESLNATIAASLIVYEWSQQK